MKDKVLERLLRYVSFDTRSDPASDTCPSTAKQLLLLNHLLEEMVMLGLEEVEIDEYGYVMGTIPPTHPKPAQELSEAGTGAGAGAATVGFLAHVDTSPDMSGANVRPQVIVCYDGGDIALGTSGYVLSPREFPELSALKGGTLVTTDGTTLLGADDKAGVAAIMTAAEYLITHPEIPHGRIRIGFTPDEEIGRGVDHFDLERFGAQVAYTVDGSGAGELEYENFNAAAVRIAIRGRGIHPGYAKGRMINAVEVAWAYHALLPAGERPEHTEGYEGFFHLTTLRAEVEQATMEYIVRDHSRAKFEERKAAMVSAAAFINERYGAGTLTVEIEDQYYNMRERVEPHPEIVAKARRAMELAGVVPVVRPIRGGTDGARLSYMGLPCPNLFTGGANFHGRYEYCSVDMLVQAVQTLVNLAKLWGEG